MATVLLGLGVGWVATNIWRKRALNHVREGAGAYQDGVDPITGFRLIRSQDYAFREAPLRPVVANTENLYRKEKYNPDWIFKGPTGSLVREKAKMIVGRNKGWSGEQVQPNRRYRAGRQTVVQPPSRVQTVDGGAVRLIRASYPDKESSFINDRLEGTTAYKQLAREQGRLDLLDYPQLGVS